ncbi:ankyrin repeat-containing domain protein [Xylariaceae sp. FL0255]|nr:ankyrin repeat-containing domain protein [Xylariaceae sp. FL0255]
MPQRSAGSILLGFPNEILANISDFMVPDQWNNRATQPVAFLYIRLVCRRFDDILSEQALKKIDFDTLLNDRKNVKAASLKWLLKTKLRGRRFDKTCGFARDLWKSIVLMATYTRNNPSIVQIPNTLEEQEQKFLDYACGMLVVTKGRLWAVEKLKDPLNSWTFLPSELELADGLSQQMAIQYTLVLAAYCGDLQIVQSFLKSGMDSTVHREAFRTALYAASYVGHASIVRLLTGEGADLTYEGSLDDISGFKNYKVHPVIENFATALEAAVFQGHLEALTLLIKEPTAWRSGRSTGIPLIYAISQGHTEAAKMLIEQLQVDVNFGHREGRLPLLTAMSMDDDRNVQRLLKRKDINVNMSSWNTSHHNTALSSAIFFDRPEWLELLLLRKEIDPNLRDGLHYTPLTLAIRQKKYHMVRLLVNHTRLDTNLTAIGAMRTHLEIAVSLNDSRMVEILLERHDLDPNRTGGSIPPLCLAAVHNRVQLVDLLLRRSDINVNQALLSLPNMFAGLPYDPILPPQYTATSSDINRTALWYAAKRAHVGVVQMLLDHPTIDQTSMGKSLIQIAIEAHDQTLVRQLMQREGADVNKVVENTSGPPLWYAAYAGSSSCIKALLEQPGIHPNCQSKGVSRLVPRLAKKASTGIYPDKPYSFYYTRGRNDRTTPLFIAVVDNKIASVQSLLQDKRVNTNTVDRHRRSALWWSVYQQTIERITVPRTFDMTITELLLKRQDINPNSADCELFTPLHIAVLGNSYPFVKLLLEHVDIDPNVATFDGGWTPLLRKGG